MYKPVTTALLLDKFVVRDEGTFLPLLIESYENSTLNSSRLRQRTVQIKEMNATIFKSSRHSPRQ